MDNGKTGAAEFMSLMFADSISSAGTYEPVSKFSYPNKETGATHSENILNTDSIWVKKKKKIRIEDEPYAKNPETGEQDYETLLNAVSSDLNLNGMVMNDHNRGVVMCYRFRTRGTEPGNWYIPSPSQLYRTGLNIDTINKARKKAGYEPLPVTYNSDTIFYMTGREMSHNRYACVVIMGNVCQATECDKTLKSILIPFLSVTD